MAVTLSTIGYPLVIVFNDLPNPSAYLIPSNTMQFVCVMFAEGEHVSLDIYVDQK